jgi:hypothetical protein
MAAKIGIPVPHEAIAELCRRHGIRRLAFFGSVTGDDFTSQSDVDVLVEFQPGRIPGLITFAGYQNELSDLLGHHVDMHTPESLSRYFREEVLAEAKDEYVEEG